MELLYQESWKKCEFGTQRSIRMESTNFGELSAWRWQLKCESIYDYQRRKWCVRRVKDQKEPGVAYIKGQATPIPSRSLEEAFKVRERKGEERGGHLIGLDDQFVLFCRQLLPIQWSASGRLSRFMIISCFSISRPLFHFLITLPLWD